MKRPPVSTRRHGHVQATIPFLRSAIRYREEGGLPQNILEHRDGTELTFAEAYAELDKLQEAGYLVYPCGCENAGPDGRCPGWPGEEE